MLTNRPPPTLEGTAQSASRKSGSNLISQRYFTSMVIKNKLKTLKRTTLLKHVSYTHPMLKCFTGT